MIKMKINTAYRQVIHQASKIFHDNNKLISKNIEESEKWCQKIDLLISDINRNFDEYRRECIRVEQELEEAQHSNDSFHAESSSSMFSEISCPQPEKISHAKADMEKQYNDNLEKLAACTEDAKHLAVKWADLEKSKNFMDYQNYVNAAHKFIEKYKPLNEDYKSSIRNCL